jgi:hypothetical protein
MACCTDSILIYPDDRHLPWLTLEAAIVSLIDGLPAAAQAGDAALILHARRLTTALQARPAHDLVLSDAISYVSNMMSHCGSERCCMLYLFGHC